MTVKRRNHGRNRHGRNHTHLVNCESCGCKPPKDKAIKRFIVRNIVDKSSLRDLSDACVIDDYELPKFYIKEHYCVSCAVHRKVVRPRSKVSRPSRVNPRQALQEKYRAQRDAQKREGAGGPGGAGGFKPAART